MTARLLSQEVSRVAKQRLFSVGKVPEGTKFGTQASLIMDSLRQTSPQSLKALTDSVKGRLQTRQDPERVVAFYMSTLKKKGIVTVTEIEDPASEGKASTKSKKQVEDGEDDEELEDEDADDEDGVPVTKLPMDDQVTYHEELSAAEPSPGGKFDGLRVQEAVKKVLESGRPFDVPGVERYLEEQGYPTKKGSVNLCLANLVRQGFAVRRGDGTFAAR